MDNKETLIRLQDLDLSAYKDEYEALKSMASKFAGKKVDIYVKKADYEKYKELVTNKQPPKYTTKNGKSHWHNILEQRGLTAGIFRARIKAGWSYDSALNTPKGDKNPDRVIKKRVQAFTDNNKASGAILRGVQGKNQFALAGRLNTLGEAEAFLGGNKQIKEDIEIFNEKENKKWKE